MRQEATKIGAIVSVLAATIAVGGCISQSGFTQDTIPLQEPDTLPVSMRNRNDLLEISDCRIAFDFSDIPEMVGIPLVKYDPFDDRTNGRSKLALCPVRSIFKRVLEDGCSRAFFGNGSVGETTFRIVPIQIGLEMVDSSVRCVFSSAVYLGMERIGAFTAERTSFWTIGQMVPSCVYEAIAVIGDGIFDTIAGSRRLIDMIACSRIRGGTPASATEWSFSDFADGGFTGSVLLDCGTWDMARAHRWVRLQIEQTAIARLGLKNLDNFRIVYDGASRDPVAKPQRIRFRVFPYSGFELSYDDSSRTGICSADLAYLGISEAKAYERATAFVERILSGQGIVRTVGMESSPAHYRFKGYRKTMNGKIEIPFVLVY